MAKSKAETEAPATVGAYKLTKAQSEKALAAAATHVPSPETPGYHALANKIGQHVKAGNYDAEIALGEADVELLKGWGVNVREV